MSEIDMRRRVRVLTPHTDLSDSEFDYHEWVQLSDSKGELLDAVGRRGNHGWMWWDEWTCNNSDCEARALVSRYAVEQTVQSWLPGPHGLTPHPETEGDMKGRDSG
jgi:hypothetical protein